MLAEAQAAALLSHPNITSVHDYGESILENGQVVPFVVMEWLEGSTLSDEVAFAPLPPRAAIRVAAEVASALAAAHERGLVHRDIKPSNVVLTAGGAKVLDFGIAAFAGAPEIDSGGKLLGTPNYLAPERLTEADVSPASDVYALGVLLYWLLDGRLPWSPGSPSETIKAHQQEDPRPLGPLRDVPAAVIDVCLRCLDRAPIARPAAATVARVLTAALDGDPADEAPVGRSWTRKRALVFTSALVVAAVAVGTVAHLSFRPGDGGAGTAAAAGPLPTRGAGTSTPLTATSAGPGQPGSTSRGGAQPAGTGGAAAPVPVDDTQPPNPTTTTPTTTTTTSAPSGQPVGSPGGSVSVVCEDGKARILATNPATGYSLSSQIPGPAQQVRVVFTSSTTVYTIRARCANATVMATITESPAV
jgi:serine/threonine-protein kinase